MMFLFVIGTQGISFFDFELARFLGFQEDDPNSQDPFLRGHALLEEGTAGADIVIQGLLLIGAIVGLHQRRAFGYACAMGQLGISEYWPTFDLFQESTSVSHGVTEGLVVSIVVTEVVCIVLS